MPKHVLICIIVVYKSTVIQYKQLNKNAYIYIYIYIYIYVVYLLFSNSIGSLFNKIINMIILLYK